MRWALKKLILMFLARFSMLVWLVERYKETVFPSGRLFSPYINCVAIKSNQTEKKEDL